MVFLDFASNEIVERPGTWRGLLKILEKDIPAAFQQQVVARNEQWLAPRNGPYKRVLQCCSASAEGAGGEHGVENNF